MKKILKSIVMTLLFATIFMGCEEGGQMPNTEAEIIETTSAIPETTDYTEETSETTPHIHNYSVSTDREATCDETGLLIYLCDCGDRYEEVIAQKTHIASEWITLKEASCAEEGRKYSSCTLCNVELETVVIEKTAHALGTWEVSKEATCTKDGSKIKKCTVCNVEVEKDKIKKIGHAVSEWITVSEVTCQTEGVKVKNCTTCGIEVEKEVTPQCEHIISDWITIKEQNCRFEGIIVKQCTMCNMEFDRQVFPATGAHIEKYYANPVQCTLCEICGIVLKKHSLTVDRVIEPRDFREGYIIYVCECGYKTYERIPKLSGN